MENTTENEIRTVIIGTGAIAREHIQALKSMPEVSLVAVCDLSSARVRATAERFEIPQYFTDYKEMLSEVSANWAHVATPPSAHFEVARNCLKASLNVICEKPITIGIADFSKLRRIAVKNNVHLIENQNLRFHSSVLKICDLIKNDELGDIVDVQVQLSHNVYFPGSPYTDRKVPHFGLSLPGGIIGDFLPHLAYLATMFAGTPNQINTVWTKRNSDPLLEYDEFRGLIEGASATAAIGFSGNSQPDGFWLRVWGTKMFVEANLFEPPRVQMRRLRTLPAPLPGLVNGLRESQAIGIGTLASVWRKLGGKSSYDGLTEFVAACYAAYREDRPLPVSLEEVSQNIELVSALANQDTVQ